MTEETTLGARAARTRAAILEAAEQIFAERGFAATRLEDVAERVGIRRASIVYYFKDKRELYDAVLEDVFSGLHARIASAFSSLDPLPERVEAGVSAWVDYVGERPTLARLLLREVADGTAERESAVRRYTRPYFELVQKQVLDREDEGGDQLEGVDPVHAASAIAGTTVFFMAAIPALAPELGIDPTSEDRIAVHREQLLDLARRLLGIGSRARRGGARGARRSPSTRAAKRPPRR